MISELKIFAHKLVRIKALPEIQPQNRNKIGTVIGIYQNPLNIIYLEIMLADNTVTYCKPEWVTGPMETDESYKCFVDPYWAPVPKEPVIYTG